jgi:hypothetical protein
MKYFVPRITAALIVVASALLLTGCQGSAPDLDRTVDVTTRPTTPAETPTPSAGLDLHFGSATFGITCATDSVGDGTGGTAAMVCSWKTGNR